MFVTSQNIAILTPIFKSTMVDLVKFIDQVAKLEGSPYIFFAYEENSCSFDFVNFISEAAKKNKLKYQIKIFKENKGLGYALNKSLLEIEHPFIMRHDIGDDILNNRLSTMEHAINKDPNFDILYTQAIVNKGGRERVSKCPTSIRGLTNAFAIGNPIIHPTVLFRRSAITEIGNYNETLRYCEDLDLWLRALRNNLRIHAVDIPTIRYFAPAQLRSKENWKQNLKVRINNLGAPNILISIFGISNLIIFNLIPKFLQRVLYDYVKK